MGTSNIAQFVDNGSEAGYFGQKAKPFILKWSITSQECILHYKSPAYINHLYSHKISELHTNSHYKIDEGSLLVGQVFSIESLLQRLVEIEMNDWLSFQRLVLC